MARTVHAAYVCSGGRGRTAPDRHPQHTAGQVYTRAQADRMPDAGPLCPVCGRVTQLIDYTLLASVFADPAVKRGRP